MACHQSAAHSEQFPGAVLWKIMQQEKGRCIEQVQCKRDDTGQDHAQPVLRQCGGIHAERHSVHNDIFRYIAYESEQCDPGLDRERLIGVHPETVENIVDSGDMSGHDFQVEIGCAGGKQSAENRYRKKQRVMDDHAEDSTRTAGNGRNGDGGEACEKSHKQISADSASVTSEHMLFGSGF